MPLVLAKILAVEAGTMRVKADIPGMKTKWLPTLNSAGVPVAGEVWAFSVEGTVNLGLGLVANDG